MAADPLVRETQKLYGLPLSQFTAARNARATVRSDWSRAARHHLARRAHLDAAVAGAGEALGGEDRLLRPGARGNGAVGEA